MTQDEKTSPGELAMGCGWLLIGLPISVAFEGVAWLAFWGWFIEPLGVTAIGYWHALALALFAALARGRRQDVLRKRQYEREFKGEYIQMLPKIVGGAILHTLVILTFGFGLSRLL